jgi:hypothetical protein
MVYKTKKIRKTNKRRYLPNRKSRRGYQDGGYQDGGLEAIHPLPTEGPTATSNFLAAGQLGVSAASILAAKGIKEVGKFIGINPNKSIQDNMNEIGDKIRNVNAALNSRQGEELKQEASKLLETSIKILEPSIKEAVSIGNELIQKEIPILGNMGNEAVLMIPGAGQIIGAVEQVGNVAQAAEAATKGLADLTTTGTKAIHDLEDQYGEAKSILGRIEGFANNYVSDGLAVAQERVNEEGQKITSQMNIPEIPNTNYNYPRGEKKIGGARDSFKKLHKEALMVGGRSRKSHLDFLAPHVNRSQILRQYGGKMKKTQRIRRIS